MTSEVDIGNEKEYIKEMRSISRLRDQLNFYRTELARQKDTLAFRRAQLEDELVEVRRRLELTARKSGGLGLIVSPISALTPVSGPGTSPFLPRALQPTDPSLPKRLYRNSRSYFVDSFGHPPPKTVESEKRREYLLRVNKDFQKPPKWSAGDDEKLTQTIRQLTTQILHDQLVKKYDPLMEGENATAAVDEFQRELFELERITPDKLDASSAAHNQIDWSAVASVFSKSKHDSYQCKTRWNLYLRPQVNKAPWSAREKEVLLELASSNKYSEHGWEELVVEFEAHTESSRSISQCFFQYFQLKHQQPFRMKWTKDEDSKLLELVAKHGKGNWQRVAAELGTKTGQQCLHRYLKALDPGIKRGRFEPVEDLRVILTMLAYKNPAGNPWNRISVHINGRTDTQVRERWANCLQPGIRFDQWTAEEDQELRRWVAELGTKSWVKIAEKLPGRTDAQITRRWGQLTEPKAKRRSAAAELPTEPLTAPASSLNGATAAAAATKGSEVDALGNSRSNSPAPTSGRALNRQKRKRSALEQSFEAAPNSVAGTGQWGPPVSPNVLTMGALYRLVSSIDNHNTNLTGNSGVAIYGAPNPPAATLALEDPPDRVMFELAQEWMKTLFAPSMQTAQQQGFVAPPALHRSVD